MLSPRIMPILSDSDSDVSISSSDDSESDSDGGDDLFNFNSLQKDLLKELSNDQIISTIVDGQNSTAFNENNSLPENSSPTNKKKLKRTPTTGCGLGRPITSPVNETSEDLPVYKVDMDKSKQYDTDEENLQLRPVRPRTNSKAQEPKGLNDTSTNVNNTDDENLPLKVLKPKVDSKDTSVRPRANSRAQEPKDLNLQI